MPSEPSQDLVHSLIRLIYEAAGDSLLWPLFLRDFGRAVRASAAGLVVIDSLNAKVQVDESVNVDPEYQKLFVQHYGSINPWTGPENAHLWTPGRVWDGREIIADEEMLKTEFYNGFLKPQGWFSALGGAITHSSSAGGYITALRPRSVPPEEGRALLNTLMPHLQTAVRLHERIFHLETTLSAMSDAIDRLPGGVIIVDGQARILVMNRTAEGMLASDSGLRNTASGLVASETGETLALHTMITAAIHARDGKTDAPIPLGISRNLGRRPLQILVAPLPPQDSGSRRQPAAILFISDPDLVVEPNRILLQNTFGLTEAEARVAAALARGQNIEQIAAEFQLSPETIRTHLKKVFAKTDTSRQGELIRLLLASWNTIRIVDETPR